MRVPVAQDPRDGEDDVLGEPQQQEGQLWSSRRAAGDVVPAAHLERQEVVEALLTCSGVSGVRGGIRYGMKLSSR
ncbi:hypothetical protein [Streptomyces sp. NPDC046161]|uniref:hypothetical protein n=1 Tax=Streptomyces sp. NPDC046161 TaxID=3155132 RepID=UPI0033C07E80